MNTNVPRTIGQSAIARFALLTLASHLLLLVLPAGAQAAVTEAWVQRYSGPGNNSDSASAIAVDGNGNVIVTGSSYGSANFPDFATIKYSSTGVPLWTNRYSGFNDYAVAVAADGDDNVVVTGFFATIKYLADGTGVWTNISSLNGGSLQAMALDGGGNVVVTGYSRNGTNDDCYTAKYAAATGALLWEKRYDGSGNSSDRFYAVAIDGSNNVVVTGDSGVSPNQQDFYTAKYAAADGALLWEKGYNGAENSYDGGRAVAVDGSGNVVVTGYSYDGNGDYYTAKYAAADGTLLWEQRYNGPGNNTDDAHAVAVDGSGNVFVTGESFASGSSFDYATIAYSSAGVPLWTNRYNGPGNGNDFASAVGVDGSGNVFVTGYGSGSSSDFTTIAYSSAGVPLWTNRYDGPGNNFDLYPVMALAGSGHVFVTGYSYGSDGSPDYATIAYSGAGLPLWTNRYNGPGYFQAAANAVAVDASGNVFVTGYSSGTGFGYATIAYSSESVPLWTNGYNGGTFMAASAVAVDGSGSVIVTGGSGFASSDYATIKYSSAGVPLWTNRYNNLSGTPSLDQANAIAVDGSGNVLVTGRSSGSSSSFDYATIKYSSAGVALWTNRYNGPGNSSDSANALAVDSTGNVIVTGNSQGDYATIKYSNAGVPLWTNRYNGPGNNGDSANAVVVDGSGNVIVTGSSVGSGGNSDYTTIAYSSTGVALWTNRYNGPGNSYDFANAVAVDGSGNVIVTGSSFGSGANSDYATIAYSNTGVASWTNRYNGLGNGDDSATAVALDSSGNVIVTGSSFGSGGDFDYDYATIAYSSAGVPLWTNRYNGPANENDFPGGKQSLALGPNGSVYVTGSSASDRSGAMDFATVKYAVSLPPPPELMIQMVTPNAVRICWPTNAANYVLESKDQLSTNVSWVPVNTLVGIEGSTFCITNQTGGSNARFYRLHSQ